MSLIAIALNLLLAGLLGAALWMGWRLNKRLKALRDSHDGFAKAVAELNAAARRAEQGLADLRAATDEATDLLSDRIEKGRALAQKLERLVDQAPAAPTRREPEPEAELRSQERRLGALLAAAREARQRPERLVRSEPVSARATDALRAPAPLASRATPRGGGLPAFEDDLFDDEPLTLTREVRR